ncbi:MAG: peptidase M3, partial [Tannerellaceae bacterium]|nr:peptidase M3 [Tannerellaceae bacterium]
MKQVFMATSLAFLLSASACTEDSEVNPAGGNPLLSEYTTPYGVPPFEEIKLEHYKPAFLKGMEEEIAEIEAICNNVEEPDFENTIVALDQSGRLFSRVRTVFGGQSSVNSTDELEALSREMSPLFSKHSDDISLNPQLFARVKAVYEKKDQPGLDKEQAKLLEETYKSFVRSGADLPADKQARLRELNSEISMLQLTFGQNMLKETNDFLLL